ncbi:hypothetical protein B0H19DRAFT_10373 [Mycena capillaripes]|nr:hypothetical protein B0H19DRAFT_10373 [Mycena capillaripes]
MALECWKCGTPAASADLESAPQSQERHLPDLTSLSTSNDIPLDCDIPFILDFLSDAQSRVTSLDLQIEMLGVTLAQLVDRLCRVSSELQDEVFTVTASNECDAQSSVAGFDLQIETQRATLAQLVCRREEAAESVRQYRSILSPVRRIPSELLCEIFAVTVTNERVVQTTDKSLKSPWRLNAVCRFWRMTALSYPPLWSLITLTSYIHASERTLLLPMLETQLQRSAKAALDIYCPVSYLRRQLLDPVCQESDRWTILRLRLESLSYDKDLLEWLHPLTGRLSRLETLEVFGVSIQIPDVFPTAPCLSKVILTDAKFKYRSPTIALTWRQITHYRGAYDMVRHREILKAAPNLLECTISVMRTDTFMPDDNDHAILQHLRRLAVTYPAFLPHLTTPVLEDLFLMYTWSSQLPPLLHFLDRSPGLNRLTLLQCAITPGLTTILRTLQTLTYLCIEPETYPDDTSDQTGFFHALTLGGPTPDVCPLLTSLVYGMGLHFPREHFFSMARSRLQSNGPGRLASLRIFNCGYQAECSLDVLADVQMLQDEGFDATFLRSKDPRLQNAKNDFF